MAQTITSPFGKKYAIISEELYKALRNMNQQTEQTQSPEFQNIKRLDNQIESVLASKMIAPEQKAKLYSQIASKYLYMREKAPELSAMLPNIVVDDGAPPVPVQTIELRAPQAVAPPHSPPPVGQIRPAIQPGDQRMSEAAQAPLPVDEDDDEGLMDRAEEEKEEVFLDAPEPEKATSSLQLPPMFIAKPSARFSGKVDPVNPSSILSRLSSEHRKERAQPLLEEMLKHRETVSWDPDSGNIVLGGKRIPETSVTKIIDYLSNHRPSTKDVPTGVTRTLKYMKTAGVDPNLIVNADLRKIMTGKGDSGSGGGFVVKWQRVFD